MSAGIAFAVARLNAADGSLDTSFGSGGKTTVRFGTGFTQDDAAGVAVDASNRVVVAGTTYTGNYPYSYLADFAVARLDSGGHLDGNWGNGGRVTVLIAVRRAFGTTDSCGL